ncbi:PEP/pyruvate-binding domain-containing protein [Candidatus Micrarchaeota archaeon]|nr:PEP/pyruvate-binding domain-containing protein [Candidatus Micrarchaeota archaeon]
MPDGKPSIHRSKDAEPGGIRILRHPSGNGIGGKGAGLQALGALAKKDVFSETLREMASESRFRNAANDIVPFVPQAAVLASGHFSSYIESPAVARAVSGGDPDEIALALMNTEITDPDSLEAMSSITEDFTGPLAVRSSASCEDSGRRSPFAGDFTTTFVMAEPSMAPKERAGLMLRATREVYASFFGSGVTKKMRALGLRPEEHHMSVMFQKVVGDTMALETDRGIRSLHFPLASIVLSSRSLGMERPEGVGRDAPLARMGFGLGTLTVASNDEKPVPCTIIFPDRGGLVRAPTSITFCDGRGDFATGQMRQFLHSQDRFDAIDTGTGTLERIRFSEINDFRFFAKFSDALAALRKDWTIIHGAMMKTALLGETDDVRATFSGFISSPQGKAAIEFLGRIAKRMKAECGFDIDMELAIREERGRLWIGFLQIRPFGNSGDSFALSQIPAGRLIAETSDCIGHGTCRLEKIVVVTEEAGSDVRGAQEVLGRVDAGFGGRYLLIGPNVTSEIGKGGAYGEVYNPGAVISFNDGNVSMVSPGTHMFNNVAMMRVIETRKADVAGKIQEILSGAREMARGVFICERESVVELDGETGKGQAYFAEGD